MKSKRNRVAALVMALAAVFVLPSCLMGQSNPYNYRIDTKGAQALITLTGRTTAQVEQVYVQFCKGNAGCVADNLKNVDVPDTGHYTVCVFVCQTFIFQVKSTWHDDLDQNRYQFSGQLYGIAVIGGNVDTGGPCLRAYNNVGITNGLTPAGWGHGDKDTDGCDGGDVFG